MPELQVVRPDHAPALLAFVRTGFVPTGGVVMPSGGPGITYRLELR